jgi:hypothetical protein
MIASPSRSRSADMWLAVIVKVFGVAALLVG